jgi:hypothetical protein
MIFSQFISRATKYLKSVRVLKNFISFDMIFPKTWMTLKKYPEGIEVIQTETENGNTITSFVCENNKTLIDIIEQTFETYVKTNIEREEKEKLFKTKVKELQTIFEKEKLESLKSLKFDIEELTKILQDNEPEEINAGDTETN